MTRPYFLRSARLGFSKWKPDDFPLALGLWGDERVTRLIGSPFSEEQVRRRLALEIANQAAHGIQYWPLFRVVDDVYVGCCGLRPFPERQGVLEIGFHLCFEHWGQGYAAEAARAAIQYAFTTLGVTELFAGHHPENHASRNLLLRLGFRYTHNAFYALTNRRHPSYSLTPDDFDRRPNAG